MLVIHWTRQNATGAILKCGIRPTRRVLRHWSWQEAGIERNPRGVYCYPYSRNRVSTGTWRRQLKTWDKRLGNYNGVVFRLDEGDFPLHAGHWRDTRFDPDVALVKDARHLAAFIQNYSAAETTSSDESSGTGSPLGPMGGAIGGDFEIVVPRVVSSNRILRVLRDRPPKRRNGAAHDDTGR